jgi:hypothetical protein
VPNLFIASSASLKLAIIFCKAFVRGSKSGLLEILPTLLPDGLSLFAADRAD